jgi:hypothetical protein
MVYMRHRRFLIRGHRYRLAVMIKYFDNMDKPQPDEPAWTRYMEKVFGMVKDMEVEFGKKEKEKEGTKTRKRKRDKMEEPFVAVPFKKKLVFFKYLSYWKMLDTPHAIVGGS